MPPSSDTQLQELLAHPSVWRGRSRAAVETVSTGFAALDAGLPGGGWPRHGLVEILTPQPGVGELYLLLPVLASLSRAVPGRWCTWVSPPHEPYAPALESHGVALDRVLVVRTHLPLWAHEQALRSGACGMALAWLPRASPRAIRRLQLAAEQGRALGVLFRSQQFAQLASPAMLRVAFEPVKEPGRHGARITLIKSRGGSRAPIDLTWTAAAA
jgi:cell division inhibitor SulA